jgi:hypothetical protein
MPEMLSYWKVVLQCCQILNVVSCQLQSKIKEANNSFDHSYAGQWFSQGFSSRQAEYVSDNTMDKDSMG